MYIDNGKEQLIIDGSPWQIMQGLLCSLLALSGEIESHKCRTDHVTVHYNEVGG